MRTMNVRNVWKSVLTVLMVFVLVLGTICLPSPVLGETQNSITITGSGIVAKGLKITLKADQAVKWKTSDKKTATVTARGVVKGLKAGKVTITAVSKADPSVKVTKKVTVYEKAAKRVKITAPVTELNLKDQKTVTLRAVVSPSNAAQEVTWKSSNSKVAKVNAAGKVTATGEGTATITAAAVDGSNKKATVKITVKDQKDFRVGVSMPTNSLMRWDTDGKNMKKALKSAGFKADLQYADNDAALQANQLVRMINDGCDVLVIAAIDSASLKSALELAKEKGIIVISYDRLLMNTEAVSYYVTFNNTQIGALQGTYIRDALNLKSSEDPFHMEITAGDPGDDNARRFYDGAMGILKPYITSGKLIVRSGQTEFANVATNGWRTDVAQKRADDILSAYYASGEKLDAWLCSNDSTAAGVIHALDDYYSGDGWPVVTGQDCDLENVRFILRGKQSMSVIKDTRALVNLTVSVIKKLNEGKTPSASDKTYNGTIEIPTLYAKGTVITKSNYKTLIKMGYYTEDMLQ